MTPNNLVLQLANLLSYLMIIMALAISAATTLKRMVRLYQAQAWVLTVVVLLTSLEPGRLRLALALLAALPAALALGAPMLLGRASLRRADTPAPESTRWQRSLALWRSLKGAAARADSTWLQHGRSRLPAGGSAAIDMLLITIAVLVAYRIVRGVGGPQNPGAIDRAIGAVPSMAASIALLLQGLFTMINKKDIIAQVIGLLVIEHGLFLAAVRVAAPTQSFLFVLSLFFYVLVTLTILLWILPELHRASESIEVVDNKTLRG